MFNEVDLDWGYPEGDGEDWNTVSPDDGDNYVLLISELRNALDAEFEPGGTVAR